jgi:hypothetical protein
MTAAYAGCLLMTNNDLPGSEWFRFNKAPAAERDERRDPASRVGSGRRARMRAGRESHTPGAGGIRVLWPNAG